MVNQTNSVTPQSLMWYAWCACVPGCFDFKRARHVSALPLSSLAAAAPSSLAQIIKRVANGWCSLTSDLLESPFERVTDNVNWQLNEPRCSFSYQIYIDSDSTVIMISRPRCNSLSHSKHLFWEENFAHRGHFGVYTVWGLCKASQP